MERESKMASLNEYYGVLMLTKVTDVQAVADKIVLFLNRDHHWADRVMQINGGMYSQKPETYWIPVRTIHEGMMLLLKLREMGCEGRMFGG